MTVRSQVIASLFRKSNEDTDHSFDLEIHWPVLCLFQFDIFSLMPLDLFYILVGISGTSVWLRLPRIFKVSAMSLLSFVTWHVSSVSSMSVPVGPIFLPLFLPLFLLCISLFIVMKCSSFVSLPLFFYLYVCVCACLAVINVKMTA